MGWVNTHGLGCVGLAWIEIFKIFCGLCLVVGPKQQSPKIKHFTFTEFIDTDGHGVSWVWFGCGLGWVKSKTLDLRTTLMSVYMFNEIYRLCF